MALNPQLQNIRQQVDANSARLLEICAGLSEAQLAWRPAETKWSIAENLLHLERTAQIFLPIIDRAIEDARRDGHLSDGPFKLGLMGSHFREIFRAAAQNSTEGTQARTRFAGRPRRCRAAAIFSLARAVQPAPRKRQRD